MKRKLFSAILFGALLTASTSGLTSCKDYDDDISNLQSQIDKLATADQLSAKVSEMQAAISAAQSAAEAKAAAAQTVADAAKAAAGDAAAAAKAAQSTADAAAAAAAEVQKAADKAIADLEAKAATKDELKAAADAAAAAVKAIEDAHAADKAAIEKAIAEGLDAVKADIAKTNEELAKLATRLDAVEAKLAALEAGEGQEEALKEIQEEVELIADALEDIIGEYTSMVTDVDLYVTNGDDKGIFNKTLSFIYVAQEKTTKFPAEEGVADAQIEFSENNKDVTTTDSLLVRVSPTNAVLNAANVSLINSQGKELSEFVEVKEVKQYNELITTKSVEGNGLWNVVFKVKDGVDRAAFAKAVTSGNKNILFAVAVKNTESNDVRRVISEYSISASPSTYEPARNAYQVTNSDGVWYDVAKIHNRYYWNDKDHFGATSKNNEHATAGEGKSVEDIAEYAWENEPQIEGSKTGLINAGDTDERNNVDLLEVALGQDINLSVGTELVNNQPSYVNQHNKTAYSIKGFYVTLDKEFAIESSPSEWNAWKNYSYTNVGIPGTKTAAKLFYGNTGTISIDDEDAVGDVIGFRVYAVNLDGTLVDPDGRAFYVRVGEEKIAASLTIDDLEAVLNFDADANTLHWTGAAASNYYSASVDLSDEVLSIIKDVDNSKTEWSIIENPSVYGNNSINPVYSSARKDYEIEFMKSNGKDVVTEMKDAAKARVVIKKPLKFLDDAEYTAKATLKNKVGTALCDVTVKFTKVLPTEAPALTWTSGYDPNNQVFANADAAATTIYQIGDSKPRAIELKTLLNKLNYGVGGTDAKSWYTITIKDILDGNKEKWDDVIGNQDNIELGVDAASSYNDYAFDAKDKNAIDGKAHEITYNYNFGKISLKKNYQTGAFTEGFCNPAGASSLSMKFNTWSMFEKYALKSPLTLTYLQQAAGTEAGELKLGYSAGTNGTTIKMKSLTLTSDIVAVSKTADRSYGAYYEEIDGKFYKFNPTNWKYVKVGGADFDKLNPDKPTIKTYADTLVINTAKNYVRVTLDNGLTGSAKKTKDLLVEATGNVKPNNGTEVAAGTLYKKVGATYYQVKRITTDNVDEFKFVDANNNVLTNQSESNLGTVGSGAVEMPAGVLEATKKAYANYIYVHTDGASGESKSDVWAWNTVVFNWDGTGANANPRFGTESKKQDFGWLVANKYLTIVEVKTADSDPFEIVGNMPDANGKCVIKQKVGTLTPGTEGTIYVKVKDCFEYETVITLKYSIR